MVLTFHVAKVVGRFEVRSRFKRTVSFWFSMHVMIFSLAWFAAEASFPRLEDFLVFVNVPVAEDFLQGGVDF